MTDTAVDARTAFAWLLLTVLAVTTWFLVRPFLSWLLATGLVAFALYPAQRRLAGVVGARVAAGLLTGLVVALVLGLLVVAANALFVEGRRLLDGVSRADAVRRIERLVERYAGVTVSVESLIERLRDRLMAGLGEQVTGILAASLDAFVGFLLFAFALYFLLVDGDRFVDWLRRVTPLAPRVRDELFDSVRETTWAVLKGNVLVAFVQGGVAGIALFVTGVPYALTLTAAMMVLAIVPVIGVSPVLGGAVVYLFVTGDLLSAAFVVLWGMTTVAVTDDYLRALVIDRRTELHPVIVLVGFLGGTYLLGTVGLFVGPILVGLFGTTIRVLGRHYGVVQQPERP